MSVYVRVLVAADKIQQVLNAIQIGSPFKADLNTGEYCPEQYCSLSINLDEYELRNVRRDLNTGLLKDEAVQTYDVYPKSYEKSIQGDRKIEPEL